MSFISAVSAIIPMKSSFVSTGSINLVAEVD
jgi:hypothetical protein